MSYRRTGYPSRTPSSNPRKFLVGSYANLANLGIGNIAINVPVDAAQGKGIQIWSWEVELWFADGANGVHGAAGFDVMITLARTAGTAERFVNDPDVIAKIHLATDNNAAGTTTMDLVRDKDFYPAVPFIGPQIHVTIDNNSGVAMWVYTKIWYTDLYISYPQAVGLLQSQVI